MPCPRLRPPLPLLALAQVASAQTGPRPDEPPGAAPVHAAPPAEAFRASGASETAPSSDPYDAGVHAFARGDFRGAIRAFDAVLASPTSAEQAARAGALRDLAQRYVRSGAHLVFPDGEVDAQKASPAPPDERTDDELVQFYLGSVLYGGALGAWASNAAGGESAASFVFPVLAGIGVTAGAMAYADGVRKRPYGEPQAMVSGALIGTQIAVPILALSDATSATQTLGLLVAGASLGGAAGLAANQLFGTTPGEMSFVSSAALWSNVLGLLAGAATGAKGNDFAVVSLASIAAGTTVGSVFARDLAPSIAHVRYLDFGALAGGLALGGVYAGLAGSDGSTEALAVIASVGVVGGGGLATYLTKDMRRDPSRRQTSLSWSPTLAPTQGGVIAGIGGTF